MQWPAIPSTEAKRGPTLRRLFAATVGLAIAACNPPPESPPERANSLRKLDFLIDWQAGPTYVGFFYALDRGFFVDAGADVTIVESAGAIAATRAIGEGEFSIGTSSGGATVLGIQEGLTVVPTAVVFPRVTTLLFGRPGTTLAEPADLRGLTVGVHPESITTREFDAFLHLNEIAPEQIERVEIEGSALPLLESGNIDAALDYRELSPLQMQLMSPDSEIPLLALADWGVDSYGLDIIANRAEFEQSPEFYAAVSDAALRGVVEGCRQQDDAVERFLSRFPAASAEHVRAGWRLACTERAANSGDDHSSEGWRHTVTTFAAAGLVDPDLRVDTSED